MGERREVRWARDAFWQRDGGTLRSEDRARIEASLTSTEVPRALVRGRDEGRAWLWVLTDDRVLLFGFSWQLGFSDVLLPALRVVEAEEGAYGVTLRLRSGRSTHTLVGAEPARVERFLEGLEARGVEVLRIAPRRSRAPVVGSIEPEPGATPPFTLIGVRPNAMPPRMGEDYGVVEPRRPPLQELVDALQQALELRRRGDLGDAEFAALTARLFGGR